MDKDFYNDVLGLYYNKIYFILELDLVVYLEIYIR